MIRLCQSTLVKRDSNRVRALAATCSTFRVLQTGAWRRDDAEFLFACELRESLGIEIEDDRIIAAHEAWLRRERPLFRVGPSDLLRDGHLIGYAAVAGALH